MEKKLTQRLLLLALILSSLAVPGYAEEPEANKDDVSTESQEGSVEEEVDTENTETEETPSTKPKVVTEPIKMPFSLESIYQADHNHYLEDDELKPLQAGDTEFLALLREEMTGSPKGTAILIPDWGAPANNHQSINFLRIALTDYGWTTFAINVPDTLAQDLPSFENDTKSRLAPIINNWGDETIKAYADTLIARLTSVLKEALNYPDKLIIIAQGTNAVLLAQYLEEQINPMPQALILLNPHIPDIQQNKKVAKAIAKTRPAVLDVYQSNNNHWVLSHTLERKKMAKKHKKMNYRQREFFGQSDQKSQNHRLIKEIYGFLKTNKIN